MAEDKIIAWVNFSIDRTDRSVTIVDHFNVDSVTRTSLGIYVVILEEAIPDGSACIATTSLSDNIEQSTYPRASINALSTTQATINTVDYDPLSGSGPFFNDPYNVYVAFMGN